MLRLIMLYTLVVFINTEQQVTATIYHAVEGQTDSTPDTTATRKGGKWKNVKITKWEE